VALGALPKLKTMIRSEKLKRQKEYQRLLEQQSKEILEVRKATDNLIAAQCRLMATNEKLMQLNPVNP
jgi:hypothetical protein